MKKTILVLLITLLLNGCSVGGKKDYTEKVQQYQSYYETVLDQDKFAKSSDFFNIQAKIDQSSEGYFYEVLINEPQIAMYDVKVLIVENKENYSDEVMQPTVGIFETQSYNLVPGQINQDKGFMNGIQLLKDIKEPTVQLQVIVSFTDYRKIETFQEFIEFDLKYEAPKEEKEEQKTEDETEAETSEDSEDTE